MGPFPSYCIAPSSLDTRVCAVLLYLAMLYLVDIPGWPFPLSEGNKGEVDLGERLGGAELGGVEGGEHAVRM